jgi:hypothetical protein
VTYEHKELLDGWRIIEAGWPIDWIEANASWEVCRKCKGEGVIHKGCDQCGGAGVIHE